MEHPAHPGLVSAVRSGDVIIAAPPKSATSEKLVAVCWMPRQRLRYRSNRESLAERGERGADNLGAHWPTMRD